MQLPETEQHRIKKLFNVLCKKRVPDHASEHVKLTYKVADSTVTLVESRPDFQNPSLWIEIPIAQFEYEVTAKSWTLYAYDRNDRPRLYSRGPLGQLLQDVDKDITCIFWG